MSTPIKAMPIKEKSHSLYSIAVYHYNVKDYQNSKAFAEQAKKKYQIFEDHIMVKECDKLIKSLEKRIDCTLSLPSRPVSPPSPLFPTDPQVTTLHRHLFYRDLLPDQTRFGKDSRIYFPTLPLLPTPPKTKPFASKESSIFGAGP